MGIHNNALIGASSQGYQISRSVRIRQSASAYLNRTPASAGNRKTWTWSGWVKIGKAASTGLFTASTSGSNMYTIQLGVNGELSVYAYTGTYPYFRNTSAVFRDYSAWYHFVVAFDSTQATDTNRIKIYVNGVLQSTTSGSGSGWPTLNYDGGVNNTINHQFSDNVGGASYFDGYLTEVNFIDGQALTPSSFGETNAITGVWQPKRYTGTYGTNGFYLNFSDNSGVTATTIGKDYSGNGNNWTPSAGISITAGTTYDSMLDVPTLYADGGNGRGNYCTLNPLENPYGFTLLGGNLDLSGANAWRGTRATIGVTSGKWYWEYVHTSATVGGGTGISTQDGYTRAQMLVSDMGTYSGGWEYVYSGQKANNNSYVAYGAAFTQNDVIGVAFDADAGTLVFYKNGVSQGTAYTGLTSGPYFPTDAGPFGGAVYNFGQRPFTYTPPTGFKALNTQNLPAPTISNGALYMAATLYTGNDPSTQTITNTVNGVSFQPDLVWVKSRSNAYTHVLVDSVRGVSTALFSNLTNAEVTEATRYVYAFNSNGFSVKENISTGSVNATAGTYVGWQWNAGGSTVTNTSGTISSQVRANPTAGFSVVTYTGTGSGGSATVGHGLGVQPSMVILKSRTVAGQNWGVAHVSIPNSRMALQSTAAATTGGGTYGEINYQSTFTSSVIKFLAGSTNSDAVNGSGQTYVAYCFAAVAGYSAFGSYVGTSTSDGTFVYLGFRPRWIMIKNISIGTAGQSDWVIYDTSRGTSNVVPMYLLADLANAEATSGGNEYIDILSNGFKLRGSSNYTNSSSYTYIYAAFAENPFKNSLAR